jgi:hypothetical protein
MSIQSSEASRSFLHGSRGPAHPHRGRAPSFRHMRRTVLMTFSMMLVQASERRSSFGNPSRVTVSISSMPFRIEPATPDALAAQFRPCRRGSRSYPSFSPSGARCRGHCLRIAIHHLAKGPHAGRHTSLRTCNEHYGIEPLIAAIRASCFAEIASSISKRVSYGQTPRRHYGCDRVAPRNFASRLRRSPRIGLGLQPAM